MNPKQLYLILLGLIFLSNNALAKKEITDTTLFSVEELQEDIIFWKDRVIDQNPAIYFYNSKEDFNRYFDSLLAGIKEPMTQTQFFRFLVPSSFYLKCTHTQIFPGNEMRLSIRNDPHLIPIDAKWFDDTAYVSFNYTDNENLEMGTRLISISGIPMDSIFYVSHHMLPRDGYNDGMGRSLVNQLFWYYYHLQFGTSPSYEIEVERDGVISTQVVEGMSNDSMNTELNGSVYDPDMYKKFDLKIIDSLSTAVLKLQSFTGYQTKDEHGIPFKKWIDECFEIIENQGIQNLILDLQII